MRTARHRRTPRRPLRVALATFKGAALGGLLTLVVVGGQHVAAPSAQPGDAAETDAGHRVLQHAVAVHHCSYSGFGSRAVPASALIRTPAGRVRQVSFEEGWDVYNGKLPGTLIAVCRDEAGSGGLTPVHG